MVVGFTELMCFLMCLFCFWFVGCWYSPHSWQISREEWRIEGPLWARTSGQIFPSQILGEPISLFVCVCVCEWDSVSVCSFTFLSLFMWIECFSTHSSLSVYAEWGICFSRFRLLISLSLSLSLSQADINTPLLDDSNAFYGVTSQYESSDNMTISCSTKVCSFGKQVVEKVEVSLYFRYKTTCACIQINCSGNLHVADHVTGNFNVA